MLQVPYHSDWAGFVIQNHHGSGSQPATGFLYLRVVHRRVEMFFNEKVGGCTPGEKPAKSKSVAHAASVLLEDFPQRGAERKLPKSWPIYFPADAIQFRAAVVRVAKPAKPVRAFVDDVMQVAQRLHVLHNRRLSKQARHLGKRRLRPWMGALAFESIQ